MTHAPGYAMCGKEVSNMNAIEALEKIEACEAGIDEEVVRV